MSKTPKIETVMPLAYVGPGDAKTQELVRRASRIFSAIAVHPVIVDCPAQIQLHVTLRDTATQRQLCATLTPEMDLSDAVRAQVVSFTNAIANIIAQIHQPDRGDLERWVVDVVTGRAQRAQGN